MLPLLLFSILRILINCLKVLFLYFDTIIGKVTRQIQFPGWLFSVSTIAACLSCRTFAAAVVQTYKKMSWSLRLCGFDSTSHHFSACLVPVSRPSYYSTVHGTAQCWWCCCLRTFMEIPSGPNRRSLQCYAFLSALKSK